MAVVTSLVVLMTSLVVLLQV